MYKMNPVLALVVGFIGTIVSTSDLPYSPPSSGGHGGGSSYGASYRGAEGHGNAYSGGYNSPSSGSAGYNSYGPGYQKETKYYYGGKYQGNCITDGLYYKDDAIFVICSNGYPHDQPCPPGTKTAGFPRYQAGYYYGYTDLCSVNLVDYGYGPEYYAPVGYPAAESYPAKKVYSDGYAYDKLTPYNNKDSYAQDSKKDSYHKETGSYNRGSGASYSPESSPYGKHPSYPESNRNQYGSNNNNNNKYPDNSYAAPKPYGAHQEKKY